MQQVRTNDNVFLLFLFPLFGLQTGKYTHVHWLLMGKQYYEDIELMSKKHKLVGLLIELCLITRECNSRKAETAQ